MRENTYKLALLVLMLSLLTGCSERISDYFSNWMSNATDIASESSELISEQVEENGVFGPQKYTVDIFKKGI